MVQLTVPHAHLVKTTSKGIKPIIRHLSTEENQGPGDLSSEFYLTFKEQLKPILKHLKNEEKKSFLV